MVKERGPRTYPGELKELLPRVSGHGLVVLCLNELAPGAHEAPPSVLKQQRPHADRGIKGKRFLALLHDAQKE